MSFVIISVALRVAVSNGRAEAPAGERMPETSTCFYPKALTGLVFRPLA
ncbi:MAG: hypothetical protein IT306_04760 [Chloroflexi bacterium]|nr:hypothetical protein [Chloroflexota bacterium]